MKEPPVPPGQIGIGKAVLTVTVPRAVKASKPVTTTVAEPVAVTLGIPRVESISNPVTAALAVPLSVTVPTAEVLLSPVATRLAVPE
jgi:hypothetical protein